MDSQIAALYYEFNRLDFVAFMVRLGIRSWRKVDQDVIYRCRQMTTRSSFLAADTNTNLCFHVMMETGNLYAYTDYAWLIRNRSGCCLSVLTFAHQYFREDAKTIALNREKYSLIGPAACIPEKLITENHKN